MKSEQEVATVVEIHLALTAIKVSMPLERMQQTQIAACPLFGKISASPDWKNMAQKPLAYLVITNVPSVDWHALIWAHRQVIGRHPECEIHIPEVYRMVSRTHAAFDFSKNNISLEDLGSTGGTLVNGVPLPQGRKSHTMVGDRISLGGLELYLVAMNSPALDVDLGMPVDQDPNQTGILQKQWPAARTNETILNRLTPAELEVARWICRGVTTIEEIGCHLYRSPHTVRTQLGSIFGKLQVHSREQLIAWFRNCDISWTQPKTDGLPSEQSDELNYGFIVETDFSINTIDSNASHKQKTRGPSPVSVGE